MQRIEITRGVNLNVLPSDKLKTNYLSVSFVLPLEKETAALTALVPKVLSRGCRKYPDMASINDILQDLYASSLATMYVKRASTLYVGFSCDYIKDDYVTDGTDLTEKMITLLFDMLFDPYTENGIFKESYVAGEKNDLLNDIRSKINNKAAYAKEQCTALLFGENPCGLSELGSEEDVEKATARDVYLRYFDIVSKYPVEINACGEFDADALSALIGKLLPVSPSRKAAFPKRTILTGSPDAVNTVNVPMPVAQGKLVMGFRTGIDLLDRRSAALAVFVELFGGSPQSKLFMNVREAKSLCYYCRAGVDQFGGAMFIQSGIETADRDKAYDAILAELDAAKQGDFSDEDVANAKRSITNTYRELTDSAGALSVWYQTRTVFGAVCTPEELTARIGAVTRDEIVEAGRSVALDTVYFIEGTGENAEEEDE